MSQSLLTKEIFYTSLVDAVYEKTGDIQRELIKSFFSTRRHCNPDILIKYKSFFIPNNGYLVNLLGNDVYSPQFGLYSGERCNFVGRFVIPIYGFDGLVHSFVGWDDGKELKTDLEKQNHIYYLYQNYLYFSKDKYMLITPDEYKDAIDKQFICIVDGTFDKMSVNALGYPATSLLSSRLTKYHQKYLKFIKHWIIIADNDDAGEMLTDYAKYCNSFAVRLHFTGAKDIDEFLNSSKKNEQRFIKAMQEFSQIDYATDWTIA